MVPASFHDFLLGSTGASAALMGLLFVAVAMDPERVFGHAAATERRTAASSAFTALINAFFISLGGLIPGINLGTLAAIMGAVALVQTLSLLRLWPRWRLEGRVARGSGLFLISAGVYGYEIWTTQPLIGGAANTGALTSVMGLLLATYAIALSRAWELLSGSDRSRVAGRLAADGTAPAAQGQNGESNAPQREPMPAGHAHD